MNLTKKNQNKDSNSKTGNNSDNLRVNQSGFKRETYDNELKNGYTSFGSMGSSPKNSKGSRKSGVVANFCGESDFDSNSSVELLMMKSNKSANLHLSHTDLENRRYSGFAQRAKN